MNILVILHSLTKYCPDWRLAISPESSEYVAVIAGRSGLGVKKGVSLANGIGVIDSDYRGEIGVILANFGDEPFAVSVGDRIAQLVVAAVTQAEISETTFVTSSERGEGGFGSTGKA